MGSVETKLWQPSKPWGGSPDDALRLAEAGSTILRISNEQIDLLAQRLAYWSRRQPKWVEGRRELTYKFSRDPSIPVAGKLLIQGEPRRVGVFFAGAVGGAVTMWPVMPVVAGEGFVVAPNSSPVDITFDRHGPLAASEWFAKASVAASFAWMEIIAVRLA